jgi:hypothetical protein
MDVQKFQSIPYTFLWRFFYPANFFQLESQKLNDCSLSIPRNVCAVNQWTAPLCVDWRMFSDYKRNVWAVENKRRNFPYHCSPILSTVCMCRCAEKVLLKCIWATCETIKFYISEIFYLFVIVNCSDWEWERKHPKGFDWKLIGTIWKGFLVKIYWVY